MSAPIPAGWYPDPAAAAQQRYWDGTTWTRWVYSSPAAPPAGHSLMTAGRTLSRAGVNWMLVTGAVLLLGLIIIVL